MTDLGRLPSVTVRVPATSANLGPGFDALGLASTVRRSDCCPGRSRRRFPVTGEGAGEVAIDESHLVVEAIERPSPRCGVDVPRRGLTCTNVDPALPRARVVCGGDLRRSGRRIRARRPSVASREQIYALACPSRAIRTTSPPASSVGRRSRGTTGTTRGGPVAPCPQLRPVVFVPDVRTSTKALARHVAGQLPRRRGRHGRPRGAADPWPDQRPVGAVGRDEDWLHQPYRLPGLPGSAALVAALRAAGVPAVLSGSGPTVLALARDDADLAAALALADRSSAEGCAVRSHSVDLGGLHRPSAAADAF